MSEDRKEEVAILTMTQGGSGLAVEYPPNGYDEANVTHRRMQSLLIAMNKAFNTSYVITKPKS